MTVPIASPVRAAYGLQQLEPVGVLLLPDGTTLRVNADGTVDLVEPSGHPRGGAAADPANAARRYP